MDINPKQQKSCVSLTNDGRSESINQVTGSSTKFAGIVMSNDTNVKNEFVKFSNDERIEALEALREIQVSFIAGRSLEEIEEDGFKKVTVFTGYNGKRPPFVLHQSDVGMHLLAEMRADGFCQILSVWLFDEKDKLQKVSFETPDAVKLLVDEMFTRDS